jgi:hypothetical protein
VRVQGDTPQTMVRIVSGAVASRTDWIGYFSAITANPVRRRVMQGEGLR